MEGKQPCCASEAQGGAKDPDFDAWLEELTGPPIPQGTPVPQYTWEMPATKKDLKELDLETYDNMAPPGAYYMNNPAFSTHVWHAIEEDPASFLLNAFLLNAITEATYKLLTETDETGAYNMNTILTQVWTWPTISKLYQALYGDGSNELIIWSKGVNMLGFRYLDAAILLRWNAESALNQERYIIGSFHAPPNPTSAWVWEGCEKPSMLSLIRGHWFHNLDDIKADIQIDSWDPKQTFQ